MAGRVRKCRPLQPTSWLVDLYHIDRGGIVTPSYWRRRCFWVNLLKEKIILVRGKLGETAELLRDDCGGSTYVGDGPSSRGENHERQTSAHGNNHDWRSAD